MKRIVAAIAAGLLVILAPAPAIATDETTPTFGVEEYEPAPAELAAATQTGGGLARGALTYNASEKALLVDALLSGLDSGLVSRDEVLDQFEVAGINPSAVDSARRTVTGSTIVYSASDNISLSMLHQSQSTSYYCGPAAGLMILKGAGVTTSRTTGQTLTQAVLANSSHMQTSTSGTDWYPANFARGVNAALPSPSANYIHTTPSSVAVMKSLLAARIGGGKGVGVNTVESAGGTHLNGHPSNSTIYHWWAAHGHTSGVEQVRMHDPAYGSTALSWSASSATIGPYATTLYPLVQSRGLAH